MILLSQQKMGRIRNIRQPAPVFFGVRMENGKYPTLGLFFKQL